VQNNAEDGEKEKKEITVEEACDFLDFFSRVNTRL